jgi:hypothetical protein
MRKLAIVVSVVSALGLAATANAAGWRDLRVDGSSEEAFAKSLEAFREKLSPARVYVFGEALKDIWIEGAKAAEAEQREYTAADYYARLDGLGYKGVVTLTDPTGDTAKDRYRIASLNRAPVRGNTSPTWVSSTSDQFQVWGNTGRERGWTDLTGPGPAPK